VPGHRGVVCEPLHAPGLTEVEVTARILVVDDDVALSEMISIMLRGEGFDIHLAQDGPEAITSLQSRRLEHTRFIVTISADAGAGRSRNPGAKRDSDHHVDSTIRLRGRGSWFGGRRR
jgi:Response regulators consisting of a CheY-like receiver domain and a winged-helix DNA-binding domain